MRAHLYSVFRRGKVFWTELNYLLIYTDSWDFEVHILGGAVGGGATLDFEVSILGGGYGEATLDFEVCIL